MIYKVTDIYEQEYVVFSGKISDNYHDLNNRIYLYNILSSYRIKGIIQ